MCAKKTTRQDAAPSKKQKPAELIELSSDSDSDVSSVAGNEEQQQQQQQQPLATPATKRKALEDEAGDADAPGSSSASKRQRKLAVRVKQEEAAGGVGESEDDAGLVRKTHLEISAPAAALGSSSRKPEATAMHVRFGEDDDDDKFFTPMERPGRKDLFDAAKRAQGGEDSEEEEDESDDDAPPEAVSSHAAAHQLNDLVKQAARAAELQAASERLKRQRRDTLFKTQARKRALDDVESPAGPKAAGSAAPALLPAELLESDDESEPDEEESRTVEARKPKKIKFETAERRTARQEGRGVADRRDGDTVYKVVRPVADSRLAPRASKRAAFDKKKLLSRGRVEVRKNGGFLLK